MARTASPERTNAQRQRVLEKAAELFAKKGFHATTVDDIAKSLKLTKGSVYYYIPSKQEILFQLHDQVTQKLVDRVTPVMRTDDPPDVKLRNIIMMHLTHDLAEMSGVAALALLRTHLALASKPRARIVRIRDKYEQIVRKVIKDGIDQGIFVDCDVALASLYVFGAINYSSTWFKQNGRLSREEIARSFAELTLSALLVDRARARETDYAGVEASRPETPVLAGAVP